jgi:hypothetical protein
VPHRLFARSFLSGFGEAQQFLAGRGGRRVQKL